MDERGFAAITIFVFVSIGTLLLLLFSARSRTTLPTRLVTLGVLLALVGLWYGLLTSLPIREHVAVPYGTPGLAEIVLRIAAVLILGGIVMALLTRNAPSIPPILPEQPRNVPPSV